ncbi:MAG TPA: phosphate ABC transporter permease PstC [Rhodocyclaceae bacterium]|nr:phosphate ABC transporter permease PstC [Rhodocyclaceae bacterium]HMV53797.1 phosphate ABC transporter permease PstC [Rhodocyclaceae bacterium]HMZ84129.1 phosphate ABC transporter permease PstC [Rhodocyclaceae bacterium]HNA02273.1 phosphate ABC transporter permease PstC [Rhodocyclaceae bacterium]HNB78309.1 phosphate ABC transporter permease PstC [Rhodocyclaceae bacterium]
MAALSKRNAQVGDWVFFNMTRLSAVLTLLMLGGIIVSLFYGAWPSIKQFGVAFLWTSDWNPPMDKFGALIPMYGTLVTSLIALIIAVPVSFGIALFLTELSPIWLRRPLGIAIELLAAIPSIVYGMWGLLFFAPIFSKYVQPWMQATLGNVPVIGHLFQGAPLGIGLLAAGIILAVMVIPFIASVMRDVFEVTPAMLKESAYGLGATTWEVVWTVVLPYTKAGVIGGIMLGLGRALGETMAVTFVIGNTNFLNSASLFAPGNSIASSLANEFAEADPGFHTSSLIELGLILFLITFLVLALSKVLLLRLGRQEGTKT